MFAYCSMVGKKCPFATKEKGYTHCGIQKGNYEQPKVMYMRKCPRKEGKK